MICTVTHHLAERDETSCGFCYHTFLADISSCVHAVNHWLVCIQRGLDIVDDDRILTDLRQQAMIYLTNGTLVALNESSVFVDRKIDRNTPQRKQTMHNMRCKIGFVSLHVFKQLYKYDYMS